MLKDIKLPFNTSLLELLTISFFMAIGYSMLYKYVFYYNLGIEWYIYSLAPNFIILSSAKLLFFLLMGLGLGGMFFGFDLRCKNAYIKAASAFIIVVTYLIVIFFFKETILRSYSFEFKSMSIVVFGFIEYIALFFYARIFLRNGGFNLIFNRLSLVLLFLLWIYMAISVGRNEALKYNNSAYLNGIVTIKGSSEKWGVVELNNDKVLLVNETKNERKFKLIEYKDLNEIKINK